MLSSLELPAWLPWWVPTVILVLALLWLLAFLLVPFSVIGLKGRLEGLEARLDEIQTEIRTLALRLPEAGQAVDFDEIYASPPPEPARRGAPAARPPIPPASHELEDMIGRAPETPVGTGTPPRIRRTDPMRGFEAGRTEPRLDWPR